MSESRQREQWTAHLKDEASARLEQQAAAGPDHRPVAGPLPFSAENLEQATRSAILQERDRCARLADAWTDHDRLLEVLPDLSDEQRDAVATAVRALAAEIRAG
ncbi:MAG TPA: hypothetical protein VEA40_16675 [Ramlibacter sp.]|nr:hypothetical protein [Ramlibacter sp.]